MHRSQRESRSSSNSDRNSMTSSGEGYGNHNGGGATLMSSNSNSNNPASMTSSPTYVLEHLATFSVSQENNLLYPADGMRRLLAMEKTNGIWTQKMMMKIDRRQVNIIDSENKDIVEQFPINLCREPTAFTSTDPKEMYNNILIFIVGHPPGESPTPSEMHIFQCVNVRARDVVEDIKAISSGARPSSSSGYRDYEVDVGDLSANFEGAVGGPSGHPTRAQAGKDGERRQSFDDTSSVGSDKYEKDVTILNRCFDDIERFIARLQHAAAAFRELEKRHRSRKSKKKDMGDGMLSMRAKPPPEREFVDIFQKFKLSFNLLAKLKAHIHDPNAPELVHFLFTPLALIVDASHDSQYGPNLPAKVVSPLLTGMAVELLLNCLTSKESELWHSLGEAWYVPSEEWKGYSAPYLPIFMDGWSPSMADVADVGGRGVGGGKGGNRMKQEPYEDDEDELDTELDTAVGSGRHGRFNSDHQRERDDSDLSIDLDQHRKRDISKSSSQRPPSRPVSRFEHKQRDWLSELLEAGAKVVQVTYPRTGTNEKELTVVRGEYLEVIDDTRKWWKTRNALALVGHVPHTIVTEAFERPRF